VRGDSPFKRVEDFDRPGVRIAVGLKTGYDLYLTRVLKNAELVRSSTSQSAIDDFLAGKVDAAAGVKTTLMAAAARNPGARVIDGSFMVIAQASGVPKGRPAAARYLREFIEDVKASGFVAQALKQSGVNDATVAPPK
jgi:polar amino acid transport system substrate-binding protein